MKLELKKNRATKNKMDVIKETVDKYEAVLPQVESILKTEDRIQREKLQKQYAEQIQIWKESKAFLYRFQCTSPAEREDFHSRYEAAKENIAALNKRSRELGDQYKRLVRIRDGVMFARNPDSIPGKSFDERQTSGHSQPDPSACSEQEQSTI